MTHVRRLLLRRIATDAAVARFGQLFCFAGGIAVLILAIRGVVRYAVTPSEIFMGVLASVTVALLMIVMGLVLPLTQAKAGERPGLVMSPSREDS